MKLSISDYAKKCGITVQQIYNRINAGKINTEKILINQTYYYLIDTKKFPPKKAQKAGKKPISEHLK